MGSPFLLRGHSDSVATRGRGSPAVPSLMVMTASMRCRVDGGGGRHAIIEFETSESRDARRAGGNVEKWLVEVETIMKKSLALSIDLACDEFFKIERRQWLRNWPGQTILTVNQITWVMAMEEAIENGGWPAIASVLSRRVEELLDVVDTR